MFRSLRHYNFRLFFIGQTVSLVGTWMQIVAVSWLAYRLTSSPLLLGLVGFASQIPSLFLAPVAGVIADRYDRRVLLMAVQGLCMLQGLVLALLVWTGAVTVGHILALSFCLGILNAFELTVRQSMLIELVDDKADLANAIALNSLMFNGSRLVGPMIAGILIVALGEGACFLVNASSYAAVILALACMKIRHAGVKRLSSLDIGREFAEGVRYALNSLPIRILLFIIALFSAVGAVVHTLLPVIVKDVFYSGPRMFGALISISGMGAVCGTIYLARKRSVAGFVEKIVLSILVMGLALALFAFTRTYWVAAACAFVIGLSMMVGIGGGNMLLQTLVHDDKRGRVMSLYAMALMGAAPFASLAAGSFAAKFGPEGALTIASLWCFGGAFVFWRKLKRFNLKVQLVYMEKGMLQSL